MKRLFIPSILACLILPSIALANAGTPLTWATAMHLLFGNVIIGLAEGFMLGWIFNVSKRKAVSLLILANYASALLGGFFLLGFVSSKIDITIANIRI